MYCICCKKNNVHPVNPKKGGPWIDNIIRDDSEIDLIHDKKASVMINNGIVNIISAGYGSKHDGDEMILAICDECVQLNLEDGTLIYHNNYFYPNEEFTKGEYEKSKKIYRRRRNLDDLV